MKTHHSNNYNNKISALKAATKGNTELSNNNNNTNAGDFDNLSDKRNRSYEDKENISTTRIRLSLKKNKGGKRVPSLLKKVHRNLNKETDNNNNNRSSSNSNNDKDTTPTKHQLLKKPKRGKRLSLLKKHHNEKSRHLPAIGGNTIVSNSYPALFSPISKKSSTSRGVQTPSQPRSLFSPLSKSSHQSMYTPKTESSSQTSSSCFLPQASQVKIVDETAHTSKPTPVPPPIRNLFHDDIGSFEVSDSFEEMEDGTGSNVQEMFKHPFIATSDIYDSSSMKDDGSNPSTTYSPIPLSSVRDDIEIDDDLVELMLGLEIFSDDA